MSGLTTARSKRSSGQGSAPGAGTIRTRTSRARTAARPPALAFGEDAKVFVGRLDGTITAYETKTGKRLASLPSERTLAASPHPAADVSVPSASERTTQ